MINSRKTRLPAVFVSALASFTTACAETDLVETCTEASISGADYSICRFDPVSADIRLFLNATEKTVFGGFNNLIEALNTQDESLVFAMNAGMYQRDRSPVGLYVENGVEFKKANTNDGPGNFHLKPNGVFYITENGRAGVAETETFLEAKITPRYATQSGPMLIIDGEYHPRFLRKSKSRKIRNGVGVTASGEVVFVKSETPVTFFDFATLFAEQVGAENALYLDGTISRLYAPGLNRNDDGFPMGPIVGVVEKLENKGTATQ